MGGIMRLLYIVISLICFWSYAAESRLNLRSVKAALSRIGGNFARRGADLDDAAGFTGFNFAVLGTYWRSTTLSALAQMKRGEIQEAMETFNLAVSTLAVWDLGQGFVYPMADKLINKIILKHQHDFRRTISAFRSYRNAIQTSLLDDAEKVTDAHALQVKLLRPKKNIGNAFYDDVNSILSRFRKTKIYADLVTDLEGVKTLAKVAKWSDVIIGPLFDAATVAFSAWQLSEAIKGNDLYPIVSSSLGLASGLAGVTGFAVGAFATAGTTLAAVAGPVGAIIGALLGIASIMVEIVSSFNPYKRIESDLSQLTKLRKDSKKLLDADFDNLDKLIPSQANFSFSWVYELNQGHLIDLVTGRAEEHQDPVLFRLDKTGKEEGGYMVVGEKKEFDKGKYQGNIFWEPEGTVELGYDFYGRSITQEFKGATVIVSTNLVSGDGHDFRGVDVKTFQGADEAMPDSVVLGDLYDMALWSNVIVKTGGGNDVIVMNGVIGKPGHRDYPGHEDYNKGYGSKINITTTEDETVDAKRRGNNVLSFEGMPRERKHGLLGVHFNMRSGSLSYITDKEGWEKEYNFGAVSGIKMFVGTPFDDTVTFTMDFDYVIRQTKGKNAYTLKTTSWGPFSITIDDHCEEPGTLTIEEGHTCAGKVELRHLVYLKANKTLLIYGRKRWHRWQVRGKIFFNRKPEGYPMIETKIREDGKIKWGMKRLDTFPEEFEPKEESEFLNCTKCQYYFDRDVKGGCQEYNIFMNPPEFKRGRHKISFLYRKNKKDRMILSRVFVDKCLKKAKRSLRFICTDRDYEIWKIKLSAPDDQDSDDCPGKDHEVVTKTGRFEVLIEEQVKDEKARILVDLRTETRNDIDIVREMEKMDARKQFQFDGDVKVDETVELEPPAEEYPEDAPITSTIDLKGGESRKRDLVVVTVGLNTWLTEWEKQRDLKLVKDEEDDWALRIISDWRVTHEVKLLNVKSILYERGHALRVLLVADLAAKKGDNIDLKDLIRDKVKYVERPQYKTTDCRFRG